MSLQRCGRYPFFPSLQMCAKKSCFLSTPFCNFHPKPRSADSGETNHVLALPVPAALPGPLRTFFLRFLGWCVRPKAVRPSGDPGAPRAADGTRAAASGALPRLEGALPPGVPSPVPPALLTGGPPLPPRPARPSTHCGTFWGLLRASQPRLGSGKAGGSQALAASL